MLYLYVLFFCYFICPQCSNIQPLSRYSEILPGAAQAVKILKEELGCKIGVTTGFTRSMVDVILPEAKRQG